jgi:hypothetical protein
MSFDISQKVDTIDNVQYNYSSTTIYTSQYQNTLTSGYIKIPYTSKSNEPNIALFDKGYVTTNLYIVKPIHSIDTIKYDAELIIEHHSLTNHNEPLYTCFLLQASGKHNTINDVIEGQVDTHLDLNSIIVPQKTIVYKDTDVVKSASVIIFTTPIKIGSFPNKLQSGISNISLLPFVKNYSILNAKPILGETITEGFTEGATVMAGYCQPIDETDPSISNKANVIVPLDSSLTKNRAADSSIRTMMNFFGFFVLIVASLFVTPVAHRILITELVLDNDDFSAQRKLNRANAADVYTGTVLFGFAVAFINYGIINNKPMASILGFYVFLFMASSMIVLQYQRISDPPKYLSQFQTKGVTPNFEDVEMDWGFFADNIYLLFFQKTMVPNDDPLTKAKQPLKAQYTFQFGFILLIILYNLLFYMLKKLKITGKGGNFFLTSVYFYFFLFVIYLLSLFNHYRYVNNKVNNKK